MSIRKAGSLPGGVKSFFKRQIALSIRKAGSLPGDVKSFYIKESCFVCSESRICIRRCEVFLQKGKLLCLFGKQDLLPGDVNSFYIKENCFVCSESRICIRRCEVFLQKGKLLCLFGKQDLYPEVCTLSSERQIALSVQKAGSLPGGVKSFFKKANCFVYSQSRIFTRRCEVFLHKGKLLCLFGNQDLYLEV